MSSVIINFVSLHRLERESGCFLNTNHLEELVLNGQWEEVERYLSAFTKAGDNSNSAKIFFKIQKQKYLEALDSYVSNFHHDYFKILISNSRGLDFGTQ